ncbi:MAG TPA: DUF5819 family protein [Bryobacteraceae bacterium]|nr:DUF5819 family protein [Bryobacteraceae bacterium]
MTREKVGRRAAMAFIAFHAVAITLWVIPFNDTLTALVRRYVGPYFSLLGLHQEWSLFAPDPIATNSYVDAEVLLRNGEMRVWNLPKLEGLGFQERYSKARYRKFTNWLYRDSYSYAWPDAARYIARQFKSSPVRPLTVSLVRHWARIPAIDAGDDTPPEWHRSVFFVYQIPEVDLE